MSLFSSSKSSAPPSNTVPSQAPVPSSGSAATYTLEQIKNAVPAHMRSTVSQSLVDSLNAISKDPIIAEDIRNNFISYSAILKEGRFKIEEYLNAVAYASYKIMGNTNEEAYSKTFPQRYARLIVNNTPKKDIASYVHAYNKGKLVNMIIEQSLVPTWVLNRDIQQRAINRLADLMDNAVSEKVQAESAAALLTALAKPKEASFQISIGETENAGMKEMRDLMHEVAKNQREAIATGRMKTIDVAAQKINHED